MGSRILYLSYHGLMEPLGQSQVYQYLRKLAKEHRIVLVSYEKSEDWKDTARRKALVNEIQQLGICWVALRYHKWPTVPATVFDLACGAALCVYLVFRYRLQIVHARSYVPAVLALLLKQMFGLRFVFDMQSLWVDERVDGGLWHRDSALYKCGKWFERHFFAHADIIISLTNAGVDALRTLPGLNDSPSRFQVITTCTNLEIFSPSFRSEAGLNQPFTLGYVGSIDGWHLFDPVLDCFKILQENCPGARLLILNRGEHNVISQRLAAHDISEEWVTVKAVQYPQVAAEMGQIDAGIFFYRLGISAATRAPTKLGEFLACGIPCLANAGVGDVEQILEGERVGVVIRGFSPREQEQTVQRLLELLGDPGIKNRCVQVARRYFSLDNGVRVYDTLYRELADGHKVGAS